MTAPHETPDFHNSVTYAVTVTVTVRGGVRHGTAERRARKVAERLANTAARHPDVLEVTATAGHSHGGEVTWPQRVQFSAANTGNGSYREPDKLDRYLDPDHERALASLARANQAYEARQRADRTRRRAVSCRNTYALLPDERVCGCVYCDPTRHLDSLEGQRQQPDNPMVERYCLCGQPVAAPGDTCLRHRTATIVVLDGDDAALRQLASQQHERERGGPSEPERAHEPRRPPPDHGLAR